MKNYEMLREQYPMFIYHKYHIEEDEKNITFHYDFEISGLTHFHPTWTIAKDNVVYFDKDDEIIQKLVFSIGLVELSSYWKITCSPCVEIFAGHLDDEQITWWKKQYFWGLGEFFYTNHIDPDMQSFMHIKTHGNDFAHGKSQRLHKGCLIPVGGGKDSIVTLDLLKTMKVDNKCYIINPRGATLHSVAKAGYDSHDTIKVQRTLDAEMLRLNKEGFLNGHTPFSALVAFSSTLFAYMNDLAYVVLSNEDSANESTIANTLINHQYSKSFQFEADFYEYQKTYIASDVLYFSLLRCVSEFQIAAYFAKLTDYHEIFRSCNVGSKQDIWCCHCPKCLFVYLILSPFIKEEDEVAMFHENLLEKTELIPIMEQLIGFQEEKPFECVGSRDEINTAICMRIAQMQAAQKELPSLFLHYLTLPQYQTYKDRKNPYLVYYNQENLIPESFKQILSEAFYDGKILL